MADQDDRAYGLFAKALTWPEGERAERLDAVCGDDDGLKERVWALIAGVGRPGVFDGLIAQMEQQTTPSSKMDVPARIIDKYEIRDALGSGGMGVVYRAFDTRLRREVALKFLREDLTADPDAKARLLVEAQAVASLEHPNICTIYEVGETAEGLLYLAMPCYEGETLRAKLERGPLPLADAVGYVGQVAVGLQRAHAAGIVHRDVKPANILVTTDRIVKILDFGVARRAESQLTSVGAQLGTLAYMSPEQLRGERVDHRADIWALGVVLFELLTGQRPFQGEYHYALMYAQLNEDPMSLRTLRPEVSPAYETLINRSLSKTADGRWPDLAAFLVALEAASAPPAAKASEPAAVPRPLLSKEGERRQASLLLMVLGGYARLAEELPPSELEQKHQSLLREVEQIVGAHAGLTYRFSGEELIILFGLPEVHEDDGLRAVRAATALHAVMGDLAPQSVITSGMVVARTTSDGSVPFELTGPLLSRAQRMVARLEEGGILVDGETFRLVRSRYHLAPLGAISVGRGEPVPVYRVEDERRSTQPLPADLRLTAFAGRQREMDTMVRCFDRVRGGEGQFVTLSGEAGLGKSRLLFEFRESIGQEHVALLIGRCQSQASRTPYFPFIDVLRMAAGVDAIKPTDIDAVRVVDAVRHIGDVLEPYLPVLLRLMGLEHPDFRIPAAMEGEQLHRAVMESLTAFLTTLAGHRPLVVVLEDWHWADEASRNALALVVDLLSSHRILVLLTYRPTFVPDWGQPECHVPIRLRPLEALEIEAMMASMLDVTEVPRDIVNTLMERTEGNPFFLEELLNSLQELRVLSVADGRLLTAGAIDQITIPATVQAVLRTRIDRLSTEARTLLLAASVVGRTFTLPLLQRVLPEQGGLDALLDGIRQTGLVQQTKVLPEIEYRFKHALVQDVAYDTLLAHQRKRLHGAVGEAIEVLYPERANEQPFMLALHFAEAERWELAVRYAKLTSEKAWQLVQYTEALAINQSLLSWLDRAPTTAETWRLRLDVLFANETIFEGLHFMDERRACLEAIESIIQAEKDPLLECEWLCRKGDFLIETINYEEARIVLDRAVALAEAEHANPLLGRALRSVGWLYLRQEDFPAALQISQRVLELSEHTFTPEETIGALFNLISITTRMGDFEGARAYLDTALSRSTWKSAWQHAALLQAKAKYEYAMGEVEAAIASYKESFVDWEAMYADGKNMSPKGTFFRFSLNHQGLAEILRREGRTTEVEQLYLTAINLQRKSSLRRPGELAELLLVTGNFYMHNGRFRESAELLEEAYSIFERLQIRDLLLSVCTSLAILYERIENYPGAMVHWERVDELSVQLGDRRKRFLALEGKARLARAQGRDAEIVRDLYNTALDYASLDGFEEERGQLLNTMGILDWEQARFESALGFFQEAYHLYDQKADAVHAGLMLNSVASTQLKLGKNDEALETLIEALRLHEQTGERTLKAHALAMLGDAHRTQGAFDKALEAYGRSLEVRWALEDRAGEGWMLERIAQIHTLRGEHEQARKSAQKALDIATETGERTLQVACINLLNQLALLNN